MKKLKTGVTTGLCAAAAAKAATTVLLSGEPVSQVKIRAREDRPVLFEVIDSRLENGRAECAVKKYSGDDPDITDGVKVFASVIKVDINCADTITGRTGRIDTDAECVEVQGGEGIGIVTKPGLRVPVGQAAINPVPMEMIKAAIKEACVAFAYTGGIKAVISIPGGAELAKKTMNERLGIVGGLSVLGTTGIVEPMSDRAVVETIKAEIDVQTAAGKKSLILTPGNYGRDFAEQELGVDIEAAIKCSNFIGETLDYACFKDVEDILLIGHAGKLVKLAGGIMNTHSGAADCRMEIIAAYAALAGGGADAVRRIMESITVEAAIEILIQLGINESVWESIGQKIGFHLGKRAGGLSVEYVVFTLDHGVLVRGKTGGGGNGEVSIDVSRKTKEQGDEESGVQEKAGRHGKTEKHRCGDRDTSARGKLFGIGTGPGDPELLTIKAVKAIKKCSVIAVPKTGEGERTAFSIIEKYLEGKELLECRFSMEKDIEKRLDARQASAESIIRFLDQGRDVGFITLGDPVTYSTYMYIHEIITARGYDAEIIPGITSFTAAAAALGTALCEGNEALTIIPAGCDEKPGELLDRPGNKVIMKSGGNLPEVLNELKKRGYGDRTKIAYRATMDGQRLYRSIEEFESSPEEGYFTIAIVKEKI